MHTSIPTGCHSSCTGLGRCYGPLVSQCCNYIDGSSCTDDCGVGRVANSTFHCIAEVTVGMFYLLRPLIFLQRPGNLKLSRYI